MATAFDGLGMQFMGKERQHMSGGPLSEIAKMIPAGLLGYGLYKSGAVDNLNDMFNPKKTITDKIAGAMAPDKGYAIGDPSATGFNAAKDTLNSIYADNLNQNADGAVPPSQPQPAPARTIDDDVNDVIPMTVGADTFKRDVSQDMAALQTTQAPAPPPSNVGQGQMGKDSQGGGGGILAAVAPQLIKMYFGLG
jgi:hypothetical protein